ncbi:protein kinase, partial [Gemmatimonadota bacterium]
MTEITSHLSTALADRYMIERRLGEGGMATVYLAHDVKHDRKVAVKVLRPELAAVLGADRFVQEIKTTANLQQPHILPLFDSGEADSFLYYVMPYVEGETLRDKLNRETQLSIEEAVRITTEVADALDYAHRHEVIHRDIKPENILLHEGRPMVADFGIALAVSAAAGGRMTETGLSLGTPHYMSPEQATAEKELTSRSDIYSLGAVMYEMLTGDPPHTGSSAQQIIMKIVTEEARPVTELRKSVPHHVAAATAKSLERLAADRFESAAKFGEALANPGFTVPETGMAAATGVRRGEVWNHLSVGFAIATIVLAVVAVWGWLRPVPRPVTRQAVVLFDSDLEFVPGALRYGSAIPPNGSGVVYVDAVGETIQLVHKARDQDEAVPIPGTLNGFGPFFSPNGEWLAFTVGQTLQKVPVGGGVAITLADSTNLSYSSGTWLDDGTIVYVSASYDLRQVSDAGGVATNLSAASPIGRFIVDVSPIPGSRGVLITGCTTQCYESEVYVYDFHADTVRMLFEEAHGVWYVPTGHVLFARRTGGVYAAPFDLGNLETTGPAVPVLEGVVAPDLQVSPAGTVLYRMGGVDMSPMLSELVWVDRQGRITQVDPGWQFDAGTVNRSLALSPDETRIAVRARVDGNFDIWVKELPSGPFSRLTFDELEDRKPVWMPDGKSLIFLSPRGRSAGDWNVWVQRADGTGVAERLFDNDNFFAWATPSPDGEWIFLRTSGLSGIEGGRDIYTYRPEVDSAPAPLLAGPYDEWTPALSPSGQLIAYVSTESGNMEVFIRPFPDIESGRWQVSAAGGQHPMWSN